ncbi:MAG: GAF domain-containing protein, partial [Anaerolineales bacterium]|nr:GAF domain-containing protein [Anaerolineales bacterium]
ATRDREHPGENAQHLMRPEFRLSQSYFLPSERSADLIRHVEVTPMPAPQRLADSVANAWHPEDMLLTPLLGSGQEPVGLLSLDDPRDGLRPTRATIEIIEIFANQAALAIENARLFQAAERRAARLLALHRVIERATAVADRGQLLQTVAEALLTEMKVDLALIALREGGQLVVRGRAGAIRAEVKLEPLLRQLNPLAHVIDQEFPLFSSNVKRSDWAATPFSLLLNLTAFVCAPILSQGTAVGALFAGAQQTGLLAAEDLELFTILANQLGAALESAALESDIRRRAAQLAALAEASRTMTAALRTDDVVQAVLAGLPGIADADSVTLWLRGADERRGADDRREADERRGADASGQLRIVAARGFENDAERLGLTVNIADSVLFAEMERTGAAIRVPDVRADERFPGGEFQPTRSWLGAPLISKGRILGALVLDKVEPDFYSAQAGQSVLAFANQAAVALDNARLFEENERRTREAAARAQRLALLNRVSAQLGGLLDADALYEILAREMLAALNADAAAVFVVDGAAGLPPRPSFWLPEAAAEPSLPPAVLARLQESLAPLAVEEAAEDPRLAPDRPALAARGVRSLLAVPLAAVQTTATRTLAAVLLLEQTTARRRFTPGEIEVAQTLANQAAVAGQNARLFGEAQVRAVELTQRNDRMAAFNLLARTLTATLDVDTILREAVEQLAEMFAADHTSLILIDPAEEKAVVEAEHPALGALGSHLTLGTDPLAHQVLARRVVIVTEVAEDRRLSDDFRARQIGLGIHSLLLAPFVAQGKAFGAFSLGSFTAREFSTEEIELCQTTAAQIASALTNAQFARNLETRVTERTHELQRERERVETLLQITTELSSSLDLDRVLARALQLVTEAVNATQGSIFVIDLQTDQLMYRAALGSPKTVPPGGEPVPFRRGEGLVGWVIQNRQPVVINNLDADTRWKKLPEQNTTHKSALAVPLMANEDVLGALLLFSPLYNAFDEEQLRLVAAAANQVGAASNNAELYRLIRDQAERLGNLLRAQQVETTKNRAILEGIADGVLVADSDGQIILLNSAGERTLGLTRAQMLGRPIGEFVGIYGAAGKAWIEAITRWSLDPSGFAPGTLFTERLELEDHRILSVSLAPVLTGEEYLGSVSLIRDITRDVEVDRLKSEFVTMVSHELRTPITPIKGYADMLLMGAAGGLAPQQTKFVEVIRSNADRLNLLVNDLLDISRIEAGRVEVALQPVNVREIIASVMDTLRVRAAETGKTLTLQTDLADDLPPARGDYNRVTQVIMNLAENAFNYTPPAGTVTLRARVDAGRDLIVEVSDTGVGIPLDIQPRLFDRFFRGENALVMATAGTGLGLSIAKQLMEMQGGRIWLQQSEPERGSTFAIALPVAETERIV